MKINTIVFCALTIFSVAFGQADDATAEWKKDYQKAILVLEAKYPDVLDDNSSFTNELDRRAKEAVANKDPIIQKPEYILLLADKLAEDFRKISIPVKQGASATLTTTKATAPPATSASALTSIVSPPLNDIEKYIADAQAGRAGQNPQDMAAAKAGDPYAQARMRYRATTNQINDDLAKQRITREAASLRLNAAAASHERELASIEQSAMLEEQTQILRDVAQKVDQQSEAMRLQRYRLQELQKARTQQQELQRLKNNR